MKKLLVGCGLLLVCGALIAGALQFSFWLWPAQETVPDYLSMKFEPGHTTKPPTPFKDGEPSLCSDGTYKCYEADV